MPVGQLRHTRRPSLGLALLFIGEMEDEYCSFFTTMKLSRLLGWYAPKHDNAGSRPKGWGDEGLSALERREFVVK